MELKDQNILFFTRTMHLGGTENVVLQLCEIFLTKVNSIVVCSCGGVNTEKLARMGIKHYEIPDIERKSPAVILKTITEIKRIMRVEKITIVHTHHRMAAFYVSFLKLYKRCMFVNTSHNTFNNKKKMTSYAYNHANLIACGQMVKKNLVDYYGIASNKVQVIPNAVRPFLDDVIVDNQIKLLKDSGFFIIGNIGRLAEQKGMTYFIQSIPFVVKKCNDVRFIIIGTGEDEAKLKRLAKELGVEEYLFWLGYRSDIQNIMSQLDLVVLSSLWEGLPLTPIEAFSVGKTIVATAVDGTVEIVKDGVNGCLVSTRDSDQIAEYICYLKSNKEIREEMEKNARICYEDNFAFARLSNAYLEYYKELI